MNLSPCLPKTPVRTPQTGASSKVLQLTPVWESVVKSRKIPPDVSESSVFEEISSRLGDLEWPVRQHAFRVLYDIIPIVPKDRLDERIIQNDILNKLIANLGHSAPGVRKVAAETIRQYLEQTRYSEKMLESFVLCGVSEDDGADPEEVGIVRENVILGTIMSLVDILKPFIYPENGGYAISQPFLNKMVAILSEKMKSPLYQEQCAETFWKIRDMIGESRFRRSLDQIPDKKIIELVHLREAHDRLASSNTKNNGAFAEDVSGLESSVTSYHHHHYKMTENDKNASVAEWIMEGKMNRYRGSEKSTDEYSDETDTDTYIKETLEDHLQMNDGFLSRDPLDNKTRSSFISMEKDPVLLSQESTPGTISSDGKEIMKISDDSTIGSAPSSPRVVLETEIQFSQDKAVKMTIVEDEKDSAVKDNEIELFPGEEKNSRESSAERRFVTESGDLIMKILHNSQAEDYQEEERRRTPRRVRFGGEVIKLRTPDSDETDTNVEVRGGEVPKEGAAKKTATWYENSLKPEIKITPPKNESPKADGPVARDKPSCQSHIPLPICPATKSPASREASPAKAQKARLALEIKEESGDRGQIKASKHQKGGSPFTMEDQVTFWKWAEFGFVSEHLISDLKSQNDWKAQYKALEELKLILINPKFIEKIERAGDDSRLPSLFKCLLNKLPESNNQQVTTLAVSLVFQLIQTLSRELIRRNLQDIVKGLCKYVGGYKNVNLKIESVQSLKMLFSLLEPSSVIDILLNHCLTSSSSKMRENSLLAIMYATMTFPSNLFNIEMILEKVSVAAADSRRRVRHGALEALAILNQFCSPETLSETIARVADGLPCNLAKTGLISAVQARLSRRVLPTVSNEGLVLYSLQIPASRRFGNIGSTSGADVNWILSGTGSVSTGSAKSRGQLNAAQRLDPSPTNWRINSQVTQPQSKFPSAECHITERNKKSENENPWRKQKNRTESGLRRSNPENWKNHGNRVYRSPSIGNISGKPRESLRFSSSENLLEDKRLAARVHPEDFDVTKSEGGLRAEEVSWALVPVSSLEEQQLVRIRNNQLWGDFGIENGSQYVSSSPLTTLRPLYLRVQHSPEQVPLSRSTDDVRRSSFSYGPHRGPERFNADDITHIRILTPSMFREKNRTDDLNLEANALRIARSELEMGNTTRIPPLQSGPSLRSNSKPKLYGDAHVGEKKLLDESHGKLNGGGIAHQNGGPGSPPKSGGLLFPNIHSHSNATGNGYLPQQKPPPVQYAEIDDNKVQETMVRLDELLLASKGFSKSNTGNRSGESQPPPSDRAQLSESETIRNNNNKNNEFANVQAKFYDVKLNQQSQSAVSSAPELNGSDQAPSTSSSNSTDLGVLNGSGIRLQRLKNGLGQKLKANSSAISKNNKVNHNGNLYPENLKPFDRPKEGFDTCFSQLESQQWEVVMLGLTSLVRLLRHHPAIALGQIHPLIMALGRQIRNLRSQVSRAACQAAAEMFVALKRNIEVDLEELAGPLFHRSADTNRFIRADCGRALDNMADNVSPVRAINVIISKGCTHQNAVVRTVGARLLLRLSEKMGPEKILSMPRETRDRVVQTGANLLMEGKLETRAFAKELFRVWSSHPSFSNLMLEAIPPNVMRHISKTLISLKA